MNMRTAQIAWRALRLLTRYPLRSALLVLSAALGVAGVACSVNYGASGTEQLLQQIRRLGTNVILITPAQSRAIAGRARTGELVTTLVERDYLAMKRELPSIARSSAVVTGSFRIKAGDLSKSTVIMGCEPDYFLIKNWPVSEGRSFDAVEERENQRMAVLGATVTRELFPHGSPLGQRLLINRVPFTIVGVLTERGQGLDVANEDNQVYVPLSSAMLRLKNTDHYDGIVLEIDRLEDMTPAADETRARLRNRHHLRAGQPDDFQVQNQKTLLDTQLTASARLGFFLRWIGGSALLVSGLGMLGISWIAVSARTREIGTRRAIGATAADIFLQVILESGALSLLGCLVGLAISWGASSEIARANQLPFIYRSDAAGFSAAAALTLNLIFAALPSRKAAQVLPTVALHTE